MLKRILLILFGLSSALCIGEAFTRMIGVQPTLTNEWLLYAQDKKISSRYIFEKQGLPTRVATGSASVVVLGDSFSEKDLWRHLGITSYPEILDSLFSRNKVPATVYNFGIGAVGPDQELRYFTDHILPLKPTIVIWQFYANDVWDNVTQPVYAINTNGQLTTLNASANWMYRRQILYDLLPVKPLILHSYLIKELLHSFEVTMYTDVPRSYVKHPEEWGLTKMHLEIDAMEKLAKEHGFQVFYILIPPQAIYLGDLGRLKNSDVIHAITFDHDIDQLLLHEHNYVRIRFDQPSLDSTETFSSDKILKDMYLHTEDNMGLGDKHLTQLGQTVVALQIYNKLAPLLLPDK